jgi:hypothetical protein
MHGDGFPLVQTRDYRPGAGQRPVQSPILTTIVIFHIPHLGARIDDNLCNLVCRLDVGHRQKGIVVEVELWGSAFGLGDDELLDSGKFTQPANTWLRTLGCEHLVANTWLRAPGRIAPSAAAAVTLQWMQPE